MTDQPLGTTSSLKLPIQKERDFLLNEYITQLETNFFSSISAITENVINGNIPVQTQSSDAAYTNVELLSTGLLGKFADNPVGYFPKESQPLSNWSNEDVEKINLQDEETEKLNEKNNVAIIKNNDKIIIHSIDENLIQFQILAQVYGSSYSEKINIKNLTNNTSKSFSKEDFSKLVIEIL